MGERGGGGEGGGGRDRHREGKGALISEQISTLSQWCIPAIRCQENRL